MKRNALNLTIICFCLGLFTSVLAQPQRKSAPPKSRASSQKQSQQVAATKVLVRKLATGVLAFDGLVFLDALEDDQVVKKLKADVLQNSQLASDRGIKFDEENISRVKLKTYEDKKSDPIEWKKDTAGFDYLITWTSDFDEHDKWNAFATLKITVKESWKIESVKDSTAVKAWTVSYVLQPDWKMGQDDKTTPALEQTETVIAPARGPILKEIRAFINLKP